LRSTTYGFSHLAHRSVATPPFTKNLFLRKRDWSVFRGIVFDQKA